MQLFNKRNVALLLLCSSIAIEPSAADEFTTTECHCHRGIWGGGPLENHYGHLTMSYTHAASGITGILEKDCEKGGCGPKNGAEIMFCGTPNAAPGGKPGDPAAFPGDAGFCFNQINTGRRKTESLILFPVTFPATDLANSPLVERDDDDDEEDEDDFIDEDLEARTFEDEDGEDGDEQLTTLVPLPSPTESEPTSATSDSTSTATSDSTSTATSTAASTATSTTSTETGTETEIATPTVPPTATVTVTTTFVTMTRTSSATPTATMPAPTWQPLLNEKKTKLGAKSICADICFRQYGAYQACGPAGLPDFLKSGKCKARTWRTVPNVGELPAN
ncbi:hypothetical protein FQN54_004005 [Arachnomyces sp. PD_36]|nr:hypothetical protein FQN54_004005 [Arachnomyces sp. PD_36]